MERLSKTSLLLRSNDEAIPSQVKRSAARSECPVPLTSRQVRGQTNTTAVSHITHLSYATPDSGNEYSTDMSNDTGTHALDMTARPWGRIVVLGVTALIAAVFAITACSDGTQSDVYDFTGDSVPEVSLAENHAVMYSSPT